MKKVLVIDNYDSFTYNLVHYLEDLGCGKIALFKNKLSTRNSTKKARLFRRASRYVFLYHVNFEL